jgi:hypothetical protein
MLLRRMENLTSAHMPTDYAFNPLKPSGNYMYHLIYSFNNQ